MKPLKIRIKTYKNDVIHNRFDMTAEDIDHIAELIEDINDILLTEFNNIQEEGDDYGSIIDEY